MSIHLFRKENKSLFLTFKVLIYFNILIQNSSLKEYQYSLEMVLIFATFEFVQLNEFFFFLERGKGVLFHTKTCLLMQIYKYKRCLSIDANTEDLGVDGKFHFCMVHKSVLFLARNFHYLTDKSKYACLQVQLTCMPICVLMVFMIMSNTKIGCLNY